MNLYVAGAALGATASAAVLAAWVFGSGGNFTGGGRSSGAEKARPLDVQIAPYMARIEYQGGSSALVPISIAFRVDTRDAGMELCRELSRVQREVTIFMKQNIGARFSWQSVATSDLDGRLAGHINGVLGKSLVRKVFVAAGDKGIGEWPTNCTRLAQAR